jgi:uncharacterized protein
MNPPGFGVVLAGGLLFALAGALHCAAMCGAFALTAAGGGRGRGLRLLVYLAGKACTYVFLGALAGAAGERLSAALGPARALLGLLVGAVLLIAGLRRLWGGRAAAGLARAASVFASLLAAPLARLRARREGGAFDAAFAAGALNGLLPCGLSALAVLQAAALGGPVRGAAFLLAFGAGTAPALAAVGLLGGAALRGSGARARWIAGGVLVAAGLLTLARAGLPLGTTPACPACPAP